MKTLLRVQQKYDRHSIGFHQRFLSLSGGSVFLLSFHLVYLRDHCQFGQGGQDGRLQLRCCCFGGSGKEGSVKSMNLNKHFFASFTDGLNSESGISGLCWECQPARYAHGKPPVRCSQAHISMVVLSRSSMVLSYQCLGRFASQAHLPRWLQCELR